MKAKVRYTEAAADGVISTADHLTTPATGGSLDMASPHFTFWNHVTKTDYCWLWNGPSDKDGYGRIFFDGRNDQAHRIAWRLDGRTIPAGHYLCHHCDNPKCVRPDHLFVGTPQDNVDDMIRKGRANYKKPQTHCKGGHQIKTFPSGLRGCPTCRQIWRSRPLMPWLRQESIPLPKAVKARRFQVLDWKV